MHSNSYKTLSEGQAALEQLLADVESNSLDWNEADTRFQLLDRLLIDCLGWPRPSVHCEVPEDREYTDYELGTPRTTIWEAKRIGRIFELPANPSGNLIADLPSLIALRGEVEEAIRQVQGYAASRGVEVAVATNGHQFVAFIASRSDGTAPLKGKCLVVNGYTQLREHFPRIWQCLSFG